MTAALLHLAPTVSTGQFLKSRNHFLLINPAKKRQMLMEAIISSARLSSELCLSLLINHPNPPLAKQIRTTHNKKKTLRKMQLVSRTSQFLCNPTNPKRKMSHFLMITASLSGVISAAKLKSTLKTQMKKEKGPFLKIVH
jgi:hypothetical protein